MNRPFLACLPPYGQVLKWPPLVLSTKEDFDCPKTAIRKSLLIRLRATSVYHTSSLHNKSGRCLFPRSIAGLGHSLCLIKRSSSVDFTYILRPKWQDSMWKLFLKKGQVTDAGNYHIPTITKTTCNVLRHGSIPFLQLFFIKKIFLQPFLHGNDF